MGGMLLENNGKNSSTNNNKHINAMYYFIRDQVESGEGVIKHCPTTEMLGDNFTKPLQKALFRKFREEIMNIPYDLNMYKMVIDGTGMK